MILFLLLFYFSTNYASGFQLSLQRLKIGAEASCTRSASFGLEMGLKDSPTTYTFVGGKGGVGKTTTSSAIAVGYSDEGLKTLVVSTDPAHSLGDALDLSLTPGTVTPIVTEQNLWALEVDVDSAVQQFQEAAAGLDIDALAADIGIPRNMVESLGLEDMTSIFKNPPPGIDEIVALLEIFKMGKTGKYDRIVVDTAPTGHTLRLLELPAFLSKLTGSLIRLRSKLTGAIQSFKNMFGGSSAGDGAPQQEPLLGALEKLEGYQTALAEMGSALKDASQTQFVVVTIATNLAVSETTRLVRSLRDQDISVNAIVCNQMVAEDADSKYLSSRVGAQQSCIAQIKAAAPATVQVSEVPFSDTEVLGPFGLKFFASLAHPPTANTATNPIASRKLTIFGGKGGVGKTTSAASWGVALAEAGMRTLVVSTDPAHSLGDAIMMPLTDQPQQVDLGGTDGGASGYNQLWAMEIDPDRALDEFKDVVSGSLGSEASQVGGTMGALETMGLPDLKGELLGLLMDTDNPPPGTDEVVAMARIMTFMEEGMVRPDGSVLQFDRVVLDTAPTGHTLRMLSLPEFLVDLVDKIRRVQEKTGGLLGGQAPSSATGTGDGKLLTFQDRMSRLEDLLHDPGRCEFSIVTIPTQLAAAETNRLVSALADDSVSVRRIIINQVLPSGDGEDVQSTSFLQRTRSAQQAALSQLRALTEVGDMELTEVPYFDTELRTVFGLRLLSRLIV